MRVVKVFGKQRTERIWVDKEFAEYVQAVAKKNRISQPQATYYITKELKRRKKEPELTFGLF